MPKIVIEGVDGSGKTTIAQSLSTKIGGNLIASSQVSFLPAIRKYTNLDTANTIARFGYYLAVNKYTTDILANGDSKTDVFDRYIYSTLTTHIALDTLYNDGRNIKHIKEIFEQESQNFPTPDTVAFLYVNPEVRKLRVNLRDVRADSKLDFNSSFAIETEKLLKELAKDMRGEGITNVVEIDTSNKTVEESMNIILKSHLGLIQRV
ncbi:MAG: deoxynucleoside kinase [Candidatus Micrarchaeota archaeon]|nr:deoxynucleoside kinase [Candidatus Micrarchaeota archaeon]